MSSRLALLVVLASMVATSGCGEADNDVPVEATEHPYDGPLYVARADAEHPRAGAAGDVVDCATWGDGGFNDQDVYGEGATAASADRALSVARSERGFGGAQEGLLVVKTEEDRVLYALDVAGDLKQAVIVRNGPATEGAGGPGWYVESWAHCDYSELPRSFTDSIGLQIWTDSDGHPVATTTIESWAGPEHCDWQSMTFLYLGKAVYVRDPKPELDDYFAEPYDESAQLPEDAVPTGFERDGQRLWLSQDKQRAFVGAADDVEVWPRATQGLGCA